MRRNKLLAFVGGILLLLSGFGVFAASESSTVNHFQTGVVDIHLDNVQKSKNKTSSVYEKSKGMDILPGSKISTVPVITNDAADCYVRAKIAFENAEDILGMDKSILDMDKDWVFADDGYLYYTKVLKNKASVELFQGLKMPDTLPQEMEGETVKLHVSVDAIQSENVTQDFQSAAPWGNVKIIKCNKSGNYDIGLFEKSNEKNFSVVYEGDIKEMITDADDFFANMPAFVPGDAYSDTLEIKNNAKDPVAVYFRNRIIDNSELMEKMQLDITMNTGGDETVLYHGNLKASPLCDSQVICNLKQDETAKLEFTVTMPEQLDNRFSLYEGKVEWIFSSKEIAKKSSVQTGDFPMISLLLIFAGIGICGSCILLFRKGKPYEKDN